MYYKPSLEPLDIVSDFKRKWSKTPILESRVERYMFDIVNSQSHQKTYINAINARVEIERLVGKDIPTAIVNMSMYELQQSQEGDCSIVATTHAVRSIEKGYRHLDGTIKDAYEAVKSKPNVFFHTKMFGTPIYMIRKLSNRVIKLLGAKHVRVAQDEMRFGKGPSSTLMPFIKASIRDPICPMAEQLDLKGLKRQGSKICFCASGVIGVASFFRANHGYYSGHSVLWHDIASVKVIKDNMPIVERDFLICHDFYTNEEVFIDVETVRGPVHYLVLEGVQK